MSWTSLFVVSVMAMQICAGEKSCVIWSSVGPSNVVQRGHSFQVYCTFLRECKLSMKDYPSTEQQPKKLNSTTVYFDVTNITMDRTYSCQCNKLVTLDSCGVDIVTGYPPDRPQNISCIYEVTEDERGVVVCTWARGRVTHLQDTAVLWVTAVPADRSGGPVSYNVSSKGTESPSASFTALRSVQRISVWVRAENPLATVNSSIVSFTLSDIAMPPAPVLGRPVCRSRACTVTVEQPVRTDHTEIQRRAEQQPWTTCHPDSVVQMNSWWSVSSLEPYRLYHFRARSKFSSGLWSPWSTSTSSWTQEEAPAKALDVWFAQSESDSETLRVYWKEANVSISRGKIIEYTVSVSPASTLTSLPADVRSYPVLHCDSCEVTVWARNSIGPSPPARITTRRRTGKPPKDVRVTTRNHTVTIYWQQPGTAPLPTMYVVEWYPRGHKLEELRWLRVGGNDTHAVLSDIGPFECYEGAVYDVYKESSGTGTRLTPFATLESAPAAGPMVQEKVDENKVTVTWWGLPRGQRRGCITSYTIYLEKDGGLWHNQSVGATESTYTIRDVPPGDYSLWMSASTAKGEGPKSQKVKLFIEQKTSLPLLLFCTVIFLILALLICLCQNSTVKRRFLELLPCSLCDIVPDPANSKWAKECSQQKGKMNLQLQVSNCSTPGEEEEPILVNVEELPKQCDNTSALTVTSSSSSSQLLPQTSLSLYPPTTYIKSYSLDSDSSDHTNTSMDTNSTVDYISSHGPANLDEEDEEDEEEKEEQFVKMQFFPSRNLFVQSLDFGGKLTLDAVKIDCSDLFNNIQCDTEN